MKGVRSVFVAIVAIVLAGVIVGGPTAAPKPPLPSFSFGDAAIVGPVHVRGDVALVHVKYSCTVGTHLWVSVKQSATGAFDPAVSGDGSGFGGVAATWWQSHRGSYTCDGKQHVDWFTVDTVEPGSHGRLQSGTAWVQFCITFGDEGLDAVQMQWSGVVTN